MSSAYVHGYSATEGTRLERQAGILAELIHDEACFPPGSRILEAGCGVGAQTLELARRHRDSHIVAIDRSFRSIAQARRRVAEEAFDNVELRTADLRELPFEEASFDAAFLCFVLEHLPEPLAVLAEIRRVLKRGAHVYVFEGDHGSVLPSPQDPAIDRLVSAVARYQQLQGGDPFIGRRLHPLLSEAGFEEVQVAPCNAYADDGRPRWVEGFTCETFIDMMRGQREHVLHRALLSETQWHSGITALERTTTGGGSFCYTFFRASARR